MVKFEFVLVLCALVSLAYGIDPLLVSKYIVNGESTPSFMPNDKENTTRVNYGRGPNELLERGLKSMQKKGHEIKQQLAFDSNIIPRFYSPRHVFVRGTADHRSIYSAYAYMLGMYPYSVNGIDFKPELMGSGENIPLKSLDNIRDVLGMGDKFCKNKTLQYFGGNRDFEFLEDPFETYPSLKFEIIQNLMDAKVVFEREYGDELYENMAKTMRIDTDKIDFFNAIDYLEDYVTAKYNKKKTPYVFDESTDLLIEVYYTHFFKLGLFKDHAFIRVFTHSYFTNLIEEMLLKSEADQERVYVSLTNERLDTLGLTLHFGNQLTFLAVMHQLYALEQYFPSFGDELTWTLYYKAGKYWVYGEYDGKRLSLESKANSDGEITLNDFITYICSKIYFGDVKKVASGVEDPHDFLDSPDSCKDYFDYHLTYEEELFKIKLNRYEDERDDSNTLDVGIHCSLLDEMHGADLVDDEESVSYVKGEGFTEEEKEVIYNVTHPIIYANDYPYSYNQNYRPSQSYRPVQSQAYSPQSYPQSYPRSTSQQYSSSQYTQSSQQYQPSQYSQNQQYRSSSVYPENSQNTQGINSQSSQGSQRVSHTVYGDIPDSN